MFFLPSRSQIQMTQQFLMKILKKPNLIQHSEFLTNIFTYQHILSYIRDANKKKQIAKTMTTHKTFNFI